MKSMTGFGVGRAPLGQGRVIVELRSVNHRFLDVRVRAPRELTDATMYLEQMAREQLKRGRFEVVVRTEGAVGGTTLDWARAETVYRALCELRDRLAPGETVPFSTLAAFPDLFVGESEAQREALLSAVGKAFQAALDALDAMRASEGEALMRDMVGRLQVLKRQVGLIASRREEIVEGYRRRLRDRVQRMLTGLDAAADPARIELEVAMAAERCDVEEELTRLHSHFDQFERLSAHPDPVGRRLDFLLQEMAREGNTIGAKSQDAAVAHAVVEIKAEIERMREQVQNVE
ncbi:MAG TPA: YicC family protein [Polyangiaceae bacterium]|nr:YicC family protein [Polyangiaceae bacterium]